MASGFGVLAIKEDGEKPVNETPHNLTFDNAAHVTQGMESLIPSMGQQTAYSTQFKISIGNSSQTPVSNGAQNAATLILVLT